MSFILKDSGRGYDIPPVMTVIVSSGDFLVRVGLPRQASSKLPRIPKRPDGKFEKSGAKAAVGNINKSTYTPRNIHALICSDTC